MAQEQTETCRICSNQLTGTYCASCGQPSTLTRINGQYILHEVRHAVNFDKGFLYSIRELLLRPGLSVRSFIREDRSRLVKPLVFLILTSLFYTLLQQFFHFEDGYVNYSDSTQTTTALLFKWVSNNYGYANIIMAIFIALWLKLFFRKYDYNFFETLILLCFMMGTGMVLYAIFGVLQSFTDYKVLDKGFLLGFLYVCWGIAQFYDKKKFWNYIKAFFSYLLGFFTFALVIALLGASIDIIKS